uniref:Ectonucleoside triphosphate diphosphohydrolase 8 n=1 Tax=Rousettus aegyptiacus TaxID=9407 RepID=A0A7J8IJ19_ROUAE|nr:ectonucleoside triphosphate diphosphohydrolase 8 [Rousettus aegyptiacus]
MRLIRKGRVLTALLGAAVASGVTTLVLILVEATNVLLPTDTKFGIVFDAGSSHTSLFVYRWPADKENDTGVVSQALACQVKGPGISSYASDPEQAGQSLRGCLEEALALVPEAQHQETPMFLGATAGMRLLSQKNSSQAEDIFAAVTRVLGQAPVDFRGAELLAGKDEGALGWITVNYVLGSLVKYSFSGEWIRPPEGTLVGALDMGGASTQITFVPRGPVLDESTQATFHLYGFEHSVYTHSYLCFGRDQMLQRLLAALVQSSRALRVRHPCYHSGYQDTVPLATLFESPCVHSTAPPDLTQNLTVEGTGNPGACTSAIRDLFNFSSCMGRQDCAFDGVYQPPVQGQFYAFSSFYHTFHFLNLTSGQPLAAANATVWEFCQRSWKLVGGPQDPHPAGSLGCSGDWRDPTLGSVNSRVQGSCPAPGRALGLGPRRAWPPGGLGGRPQLAPPSRTQVEATWPGQQHWLRDQCASGLYILTLLLHGYGFGEDTWPSLEFRKQAGGADIGWTLGYMLNLTGMIPARAPVQWRAQSRSVWAASVVFAVLTLVAVLMAAAAQLPWHQDRHGSHSTGRPQP